MSKKLLLPLAALLLLVIGYIGSLYWRASTDPNAQIWANQQKYLQEEKVNDVKWNALEAADTYGGTTPQETWRLFTTALEKGDVELAAKYFRVDKQEEKLKEFLIGKEKGYLNRLINVIKLDKRGEYSYDKKGFTYVTKSVGTDKLGYTFILKLNPHTNLWKIYEM